MLLQKLKKIEKILLSRSCIKIREIYFNIFMGPSWKERIVRLEIDNINCILQSKFNKYTPKRQLVKTRYQVDVFFVFLLYIVSCRGVVQLVDLVPGYPREIPLRLGLVSLFYSLKVSLDLKIKITWLIWLSH